MEKLIHKPNGSLVPEDKARTVGTRYRSPARKSLGTATVTEESIERLNEGRSRYTKDKPIIWGVWSNAGSNPCWSYQENIEFIDD